jgi:DNA repair exonuclease SbcCD ATPase subunit
VIKHIEINNFCGIELLKIDVSKFNLFYGKSLQGKTSIIDAIKWAILGGNEDFYIRNGASTAEVILYSDNGTRIERRLTRGGTSKLFIYNKKDQAVPTPQKVLNNMFNPFLFGPTDLLKMKDKDLNTFISEAISKRLILSEAQIKTYHLEGVDLSTDPVNAIKAHYDILYNERTEVNRFIKSASMQSSVIIPNVTKEDIDELEKTILELKTNIDKAKSQNAKVEIIKKNLAIKTTTEANIEVLQKQIDEIEKDFNGDTNFFNTLETMKENLKINQDDLARSKEHYRLLKEALTKIENSEVKCPLHSSIICTTNMADNVKQMKDSLKEIETKGKAILTTVQEQEQQVKLLEAKIQASKDLNNKKLELDRSKSLLTQLEIIDLEPIDLAKLETEFNIQNDKLSKMKISLEMSKATGLKEMQIRQEELNIQLTELNKLIKEIIPNMLTLNVKNVTLSKDGIHFQGLPLSRHGDSLKLRICTAILKDLFPTSNLFCLDRIECIDQGELAKYIAYYAKENNTLQYFGTFVGELNFQAPLNAKFFKIEKFKVV